VVPRTRRVISRRRRAMFCTDAPVCFGPMRSVDGNRTRHEPAQNGNCFQGSC
jgi:hypothetical protein